MITIDETAFKYDEIESHFKDYILENGEYLKENDTYFLDDLHHHAFNEDYYIIGNYQAKKWLEDSVFDVFEVIRQYESDNFGEVNTNLSSPESVVNMYTYIIGEYIVYKWREQYELVEAISRFVNLFINNQNLKVA